MAENKNAPTLPGLRSWSLWLILLLWIVAAWFGTAGQYLSREAHFFTPEGETVDFCLNINTELVEAGTAEPSDWCTRDSHLGSTLPADVESAAGDIRIDAETIRRGFTEMIVLPDLWLTVSLGGSAIIFFFVFARATGTVRAGLAAAISVVFFGFLLFPAFFTSRVPGDMRSELVTAWQWVVIFYFGSEAAVQAWKVSHPDGAQVSGDVQLATTQSSTTGVPDRENG